MMDKKLMVRYFHKREGGDPQCIKFFPNQDLVLAYFILSVLWVHLLEGLGHSVPHSRDIEQVMVMTTNFMTLGYNYAVLGLNNPPLLISTLTHFGRLITWNTSSLA